MPYGDTGVESLWLTVSRTINGVNKTFIERMSLPFIAEEVGNESSDIRDKMIYCDAASYVYDPVAFDTRVLPAYAGETLVAIGDGSYMGEFTLSLTGEIVLPIEVNHLIVGYNYSSYVKTLRLDEGSGLQSSQMAVKRIDRITIRFTRTIGGFFGQYDGELEEIYFNEPNQPANAPIPIFTGDKLLDMPATYDRDGQVIVRQDFPLPMEITGLIMRGILYD